MLEKYYKHELVEKEIYESWEKDKDFVSKVTDKNSKPFCIVIPPPNVTGTLHMGHALNNTLQDILIRYQRMQGKDVLWQPGMDHAGIATEMVVERELKKEGIEKSELSREEFVEKVWEWKDLSGGLILNQLKRLGSSCNWDRERFTFDKGLSEAVRKVFVELFNQGLIYRDKRLSNWDPKLKTTISDLEVVQKEIKGSLWYIEYDIEESEDKIIVATTRPETMLGDTGIAVHPDDDRYKKLVVKNAIQLANSASTTDNYYNGATVIVTTTTADGTPYIQERQILDYNGSSRIAIVNAPWDWQHIPDTNDSYKIGSIGDRRVTLNPSMQLLDYLTNKRYGKGLDITKDIDLDQFKGAAVKCDTRAEVTMVFSTGTTFTEEEKYQYPQSGNLQWRGTVKKVVPAGGKQVVTFKDVIGKLGHKWNSYKTFASGELYWYDGKVYTGAGSVVSTAPGGSGAETSVTLYKVGGGTAALDISTAAANGNPLVKSYSFVTGSFSASGYTLYDCDDVKYWKYLGWDSGDQRNVTRHQMNQVIDTKLPLFENINTQYI